MKILSTIWDWAGQAWRIAVAGLGLLVVLWMVQRARSHRDRALRSADEAARMRVNDDKTRRAAQRVSRARRKAVEHSEKALEIKHEARKKLEDLEQAPAPLPVRTLADRLNRL